MLALEIRKTVYPGITVVFFHADKIVGVLSTEYDGLSKVGINETACLCA